MLVADDARIGRMSGRRIPRKEIVKDASFEFASQIQLTKRDTELPADRIEGRVVVIKDSGHRVREHHVDAGYVIAFLL